MYTWHTKQAPFETYVLRSESEQTYFEVVPQRGAIVSRYVYQGQDVFYLDEETLVDTSKNIRGGNPVLFPISSYLENEAYTYEGKEYQLKQHGFARNLPAQVTHVGADEKSASITLEIVHNDESLSRYPFQFKLELTYTLSEQGLSIQADVTNLDNKEMPFYLGYHPYFYVADKSTLQLEVPSQQYEDMIANSVVDGQFNFEQQESNAIYEQLQANHCHMIDQARGLKVSVGFDEVYQYVVLWALEGKPFVCIEPWMAPVNGMNVNKGVQRLQPGDTHSSVVTVAAGLI